MKSSITVAPLSVETQRSQVKLIIYFPNTETERQKSEYTFTFILLFISIQTYQNKSQKLYEMYFW